MTREEEIISTAREYEQHTGFGDIVRKSHGHGVDSAYGIGFLEGAVWADEHPQYNPYKASIESIKECIERFRECGNDKDDLINNIYVKCKDAIEYANTFKD